MLDLSHHVALITGASSGIGRAIAIGLAGEGARLAIVGRDLTALEKVAADAGHGSARVETYEADLARDDDIDDVASRVQADFGAVQILVHSAGLTLLGEIESTPIEQLDRQLATNVRAPYLLTQRLLPGLKKQRGQIVFINSTAGLDGRRNVGAFAASKHALRAIADCLRAEVNASGVRVLSAYPGRTASPTQAAVHRAEGRTYRPELLMQPDDVAAAVIGCLRLPRSAEVTEIKIRPLVKSY
jgi:NADP-dependent 3-hydroxy acid dehydrogenase YdfG